MVDYNRKSAIRYANTYCKRTCDCNQHYDGAPPDTTPGQTQLGGGEQEAGDCAHFLSHCLEAGGISNRNDSNSDGQCSKGKYIVTVQKLHKWLIEKKFANETNWSDLKAGDLIFFKSRSHVMIHIGQKKFSGHTNYSNGVTIDPNDVECLHIIGEPLVFYFYASWSPTSKRQIPELNTLQNSLGEYISIKYIDLQEQPQLKEQYSLKVIPTILILKNGRILHQFEGFTNANIIEKSLNPLI